MRQHLRLTMSLWDMITSINGRAFGSISNIGQMILMIHEGKEATHKGGRVAFTHHSWGGMRQDLEHILIISKELNLDATSEFIRYAISLLDRNIIENGYNSLSRTDAERLTWTLDGIRRSFGIQMASRIVLVMDTKHAHLLISDEPLFGRLVEDVFPTAGEEISEAAKCLALQRPTAVVFHLMRAMELAVQRMARALGRKDPEQKVWGIILADLHTEIQKMSKGRVRDDWSACHTHLYHVKQAWRNDTMHPKTTYTEAQAETVFEAVKSFMTHLAQLVSQTEGGDA